MIRFLALTIFCTLLAIAPSHAQDQAVPSEPQKTQEQKYQAIDYEFGYSPEHCDFYAGFPEEPLAVNHCENEDDAGTCFDLVTYTKVFGLSSTVKIQVICNPATDEMYDHFTEETMQATVRSMTSDKVIKEFNIESREGEGYRQTGIVAQGRQGLHDTLYIAQLWVAKNSIMSVQAELMGEQTPEADELFANILRNIGHVTEIKGEEFGTQKIQAWEKKKESILKNIAETAAPSEEPAAP